MFANVFLNAFISFIIALIIAWIALSVALLWIQPVLYNEDGALNWLVTLGLAALVVFLIWLFMIILYFIVEFFQNRYDACDPCAKPVVKVDPCANPCAAKEMNMMDNNILGMGMGRRSKMML
jgi:hypothetical protein